MLVEAMLVEAMLVEAMLVRAVCSAAPVPVAIEPPAIFRVPRGRRGRAIRTIIGTRRSRGISLWRPPIDERH